MFVKLEVKIYYWQLKKLFIYMTNDQTNSLQRIKSCLNNVIYNNALFFSPSLHIFFFG